MLTQAPETWSALLRNLLDQHLPSPALSGQVAVTCGLIFAFGMLLVFSGIRLARPLAGLAGALAGGWGGASLGATLGVSAPLCAALGALAVGWLIWSTDRFWLIVATAAIVLAAGSIVQSDAASVSRLMSPAAADTARSAVEAEAARVAARAATTGIEQQASDWLSDAGRRIKTHFAAQTPRGIIVPAVAAILAVVIALRAARLLAGIWIGLGGAALAVGAALVVVGGVWPGVRGAVSEQPTCAAGAAAGLWAVGLVTQALKRLQAHRRAARANAAALAKA